MVNKKIVIVATIIAILVVVGIVYISLQNVDNSEQEDNSVSENVEYISENIVVNETEENVQENETVENIVEENETEEQNVSEETNSSDEQEQEAETEEELSDEDKAIDLVKKEWGENDNTVYYYIEEQISDYVYLISVRDNETTEAMGSYTVNISTGVVEK